MTLWQRVYAERRRVILPLIIVAIVNVAVLLLVVLPLSRSVEAAEGAAQDASVRLAAARQLERQAQSAGASKTRAERELAQFYTNVLPRGLAVATSTTNRWLQQAASDAGLEYRAATFSWEAIRESTLSRAYSTVTLRGRYQDIRRFLYAVETATEFIVVERVELAQSSTTASSASGMIEVALVVSTFFVAEPPPQ